MKKFLSILLALMCATIFSSCNPNPNDEYISQLRRDIMRGTSDGFDFTAYIEERETPLQADGIPNAKIPVVVLKISTSTAISGTSSVFITIDGKEYSAHPTTLSPTLFSSIIPVDALPSDTFTARFESVGDTAKNVSVTLSSVLPEMSDYTAPLALAKSTLGDKITYENNVLVGEFFIRVLHENGTAFWYVGYVTASSTHSLLISADGQTVIATHESKT